jgi:hypothetical protein
MMSTTSLVLAQYPLAHPDIDLHGKLYRSIFVFGPGRLSSGDLAEVPEPLRTRLGGYLTRSVAFRSRLESTATSFEEAVRDAKKREIERAIVALVDSADSPRLALEFIRPAPIAHKWEGAADGPVGEASYAETFLERNPSSALAPFLCLFIAHRQRIAFEIFAHQNQPDGEKRSAQKYLQFIGRARAATDAVYGLIADDMDRQPYLFLKTERHPREYAGRAADAGVQR